MAINLPKPRKVKVFDTTLRDGEQGIGFCMTPSQKKRTLKKLDSLSLDVIELGFPAASPEDRDWIEQALSMKLKTKTCVFTRLNKNDINTLIKTAAGKSVQVQLLAVGSEIHIEKKRKITLADSLIELEQAIQQLNTNGHHDICVILEDATRGSLSLLKEITQICLKNNITGITIADTVGCATPSKIFKLIDYLKKITPENFEIGIHCHNDMGLATANTLSAIEVGATLIQTTMGGIGERAGNCALEEVFAALHFCKDEYHAEIIIDPIKLYNACHFVFKETGKLIATNKPIIGEHVFSTTAGLHQDGLIKDSKTYTHVNPEIFEKKHNLIFNRLSGRKLIQTTLHNQKISPDLLPAFIDHLTDQKKDFTEAEISKELLKFQRIMRKK